jgi:hypothetical protein
MTNKVTQERRKLFPKITELLNNGAKSTTRAVEMLPESELPGDGGTSKSRKSALVRQYNKENQTA